MNEKRGKPIDPKLAHLLGVVGVSTGLGLLVVLICLAVLAPRMTGAFMGFLPIVLFSLGSGVWMISKARQGTPPGS